MKKLQFQMVSVWKPGARLFVMACRPPPGLPHTLLERRGLNPFALQAGVVAASKMPLLAQGDQDKQVKAHGKISMFFVLSPTCF